jgi:hypothetical protein
MIYKYNMDEELNHQKINNEDNIECRCKILAEMINNIKDIYKTANENQKAFIQTIIGAAIWYIPKPKMYWTGKISVEAIKSFLPQNNEIPKLSEEHDIPRKIAAKQLLEKEEILTSEYVKREYLEKYCKIHYITPNENRRAIKFQKAKIYQESKKVYKDANIKLIKISVEQLKQIKERNEEIINNILNI